MKISECTPLNVENILITPTNSREKCEDYMNQGSTSPLAR